MSLDIIIPVLNESFILNQHATYYHELSTKAHLIFVDGGSRDDTVTLAQQYGVVLQGPQGRGLQKNFGITASSADQYLFLHVDTQIPLESLPVINNALKNNLDYGGLTLHINDRHVSFRLYENIVNFRTKARGIIDGDCGFFIRRSVFEAVGGFDALPYMEDICLSQRLTKHYRYGCLPERITVSSRKWHEKGFGHTLLTYSRAYLDLWTGRLKTTTYDQK